MIPVQVDVVIQVLICQSRMLGNVVHSEVITLFMLWIRSQGKSVRGSSVEMVMLALGNSLCAFSATLVTASDTLSPLWRSSLVPVWMIMLSGSPR